MEGVTLQREKNGLHVYFDDSEFGVLESDRKGKYNLKLDNDHLLKTCQFDSVKEARCFIYNAYGFYMTEL